MRLVIALMSHETNTFSPVPTPLERFGANGAVFGEEASAAYRNTNTGIAAYLDLAAEVGAEIVTPLAAEAPPSGPVEADAYRRFSDAIVEAVDHGCDACLLDLHGAMVAESTDDGEGTLLERIRCRAPGLPIAVSLDLHANVTDAMVDNASVIAGYLTYPHIDMYETGMRAGRIVLRALAGEVEPVMAWGNRPMLAHTLRMGTDDEPMRSMVGAARRLEDRREVLAASVFGGFPLADIRDAGSSVVVVTDRDRGVARRQADALLDELWRHAPQFVWRSEPLRDSVMRARALDEGPIVLIDHADNCASGGTEDTMAVLAEVMRQGLEEVAMFAVYDPRAVEEMIKAGIGAEVNIALGGKISMPSIGRQGEPLAVSGTVRAITNGEFVVRGPMYTGLRQHLGPTVVLDTGQIEIVVISRHHEPYDLGVFRSVGIEPTERRYLLLKSRIHYRAGFKPIARHIVECDGVGVTSSDYGLFRFEKVRRPIFPLDDIAGIDGASSARSA